jgi:DNA-binding transcriptional MerR regulator
MPKFVEDYGYLMSAADVAQYTGLSKKSLRYYAEQGICRPYVHDPSNNYSYYIQPQLEYLLLIKRLREADISLAAAGLGTSATAPACATPDKGERSSVTGGAPQGNIDPLALMRSAKEQLEAKIAESQLALKDIEYYIEAATDQNSMRQQDEYYLRYIFKRHYALRSVAQAGEGCSYRTTQTKALLALRQDVHEAGLSASELFGSLLLADAQTLEPREQLVFVELTELPPQFSDGRTQNPLPQVHRTRLRGIDLELLTLPPGFYLCQRYRMGKNRARCTFDEYMRLLSKLPMHYYDDAEVRAIVERWELQQLHQLEAYRVEQGVDDEAFTDYPEWLYHGDLNYRSWYKPLGKRPSAAKLEGITIVGAIEDRYLDTIPMLDSWVVQTDILAGIGATSQTFEREVLVEYRP